MTDIYDGGFGVALVTVLDGPTMTLKVFATHAVRPSGDVRRLTVDATVFCGESSLSSNIHLTESQTRALYESLGRILAHEFRPRPIEVAVPS